MALRPSPRPRSQLQAIFSYLTPCQQRCAASTKSFLRPSSTPSQTQLQTQRDQWKRLCRQPRRGLMTQSTGFEGHQLPALPHDEIYGEQGIDGFLSPEGFDLAWTQYQSMMIEKLNQLTMGTADATTKPQRLVEKYGRSSHKASLFNHASMACNNHIFFSCLSPTKTEPTPSFASEIEDSFSSHQTLRIEMLETADAMFGPGFVWIVKDQEQGKMKLLCTYLAGSPLPAAHFRAQQIDMATYSTAVPNAQRFMNNPRHSHAEPTNQAGSFGPYSATAQNHQRAPGNYSGQPILCVNTWEHAYLRDYGVGGKRAYLERWWDRIDWAVVERNASVYGPERNPRAGLRPDMEFYNALGHSFKRNVSPY